MVYLKLYHELCIIMLGDESPESAEAAVWVKQPTEHPAHAESAQLQPVAVFQNMCAAAKLDIPQQLQARIADAKKEAESAQDSGNRGGSSGSEGTGVPAASSWTVCGRGPHCPTTRTRAACRSPTAAIAHCTLLHDLYNMPSLVRLRDWSETCPAMSSTAKVDVAVEHCPHCRLQYCSAACYAADRAPHAKHCLLQHK